MQLAPDDERGLFDPVVSLVSDEGQAEEGLVRAAYHVAAAAKCDFCKIHELESDQRVLEV